MDPASDPALQLAALTVQASLGDYDPEQHREGYTHKYLEFLYGSESTIVRLHSITCGDHVRCVSCSAPFCLQAADAEDRVRAVHQEKR